MSVSELEARLRAISDECEVNVTDWATIGEAADQLERYRVALEKIAKGGQVMSVATRTARQALEPKP